MDLKNLNINAVIQQVASIITTIVSLVLLCMIAATVARTQGWNFPYIRPLDPTPLAYLCGAWWLYKK